MKYKALLVRAAKWVLYPAFYGFALVFCFYLTFPWDSLKNRIVSEFAKSQASKGDKAWRLQIDQMSGYWFTGVEIDNAKIIMPTADDATDAKKSPAPSPDDAAPASSTKKDDAKPGAAATPAESSVVISKAHARVELLPLLIGRVRIDFQVDAFGGDVKGTIPLSGGTVDVELENVDLGQVAPIRDLVSLPLKGVANGKFELTSDSNGKWAKSNGSLALTVKDVVLGDGKAKFMKQATLPPASLGTLEIAGKATDGTLKFDKFGAQGKDVQVVGQGSLRIRDPWDASQLDLVLRFGFSDAYKVKDDKTIALFGDPNDPTALPLIDFEPKMKQAKRPDGMWGFRGKGPIKALQWTPTRDDGPQKTPGPNGTDSDTEAPAPTVAQNPVGIPPRPMIPGGARFKGGGADGAVAPGFRATPAAERVGAQPQGAQPPAEFPNPAIPPQGVPNSVPETMPPPQQLPAQQIPQPLPQPPVPDEREQTPPPAPPP